MARDDLGERPPEPAAAIADARRAQAPWAARPLAERVAIIARTRASLAEDADGVVEAVGPMAGRTPGETIAAELVPLMEACRFVERRAARLLAPRRPSWRERSTLMMATTSTLHREPRGVVLILAPANYRLFLAGTQTVQALAAGNAVVVKPAPGAEGAMALLARHLVAAGLPEGLFTVLACDHETGARAVEAGADLVVLTGGAETGRRVMAALAASLTPSIMELSGADASVVLPGADLAMAADCLAWGVSLNAGMTCIAPRRVFAADGTAERLEALLAERLGACRPRPVEARHRAEAAALVDDALEHGARLVGPYPAEAETMAPCLVVGPGRAARILREAPFAPIMALVPVADAEEALDLDRLNPYGLAASVFGPKREAAAIAARLNAGTVTINDLIAPTAEPSMPFEGRGTSGFGPTQGAEGLLAMTRPKVVARTRGRMRPQTRSDIAEDAELMAGAVALMHGRRRGAALGRLARALRRRLGRG
ncbi:MAG: aldehyde dehydrogenase family protein [Paracoccaceae bacterium]